MRRSSRPAQGTTAEEVLKTLAEEDSKKNIPAENRDNSKFHSDEEMETEVGEPQMELEEGEPEEESNY